MLNELQLTYGHARLKKTWTFGTSGMLLLYNDDFNMVADGKSQFK